MLSQPFDAARRDGNVVEQFGSFRDIAADVGSALSCRTLQNQSDSVSVPGPCPRNFSSPSHGPCSPESTFNLEVDRPEYISDIALPRPHLDRDIPTNSRMPIEIENIEAPSKLDRVLELELRTACANALSICSFQENQSEDQIKR